MNLALFDFDGTITFADTFTPFIYFCSSWRRIALGTALLGRYADGDCTGFEKARRVRARYDLTRHPVIYAYGDTKEDEELLGVATKPFFRWQEIQAAPSASS